MEPISEVSQKHFVNRVTPFSKALALFLFVTLPVLTLYVGFRYGIDQRAPAEAQQSSQDSSGTDFDSLLYSNPVVSFAKENSRYERIPLGEGKELVHVTSTLGTDGRPFNSWFTFTPPNNFVYLDALDYSRTELSPDNRHVLFAKTDSLGRKSLGLADTRYGVMQRFSGPSEVIYGDFQRLAVIWIDTDQFAYVPLKISACVYGSSAPTVTRTDSVRIYSISKNTSSVVEESELMKDPLLSVWYTKLVNPEIQDVCSFFG